MSGDGQLGYDTESLHVVGHRQIDAGNRYRRNGRSNGMQLIRSADDQCFRLVRVQLKSVLHVPLLDLSSTRGENGQPVGCVVGVYGETELGIICVRYCTPWLAMTSVTRLQ